MVGEDPPAVERFIANFDTYMRSMILEAEDRAVGHVRTVNDYMILRRNTCAARPTFAFYGLGLNIPSEVFDNPHMISLIENAADLVALTNVSHFITTELNPILIGLQKIKGYAFISPRAFMWTRWTQHHHCHNARTRSRSAAGVILDFWMRIQNYFEFLD